MAATSRVIPTGTTVWVSGYWFPTLHTYEERYTNEKQGVVSHYIPNQGPNSGSPYDHYEVRFPDLEQELNFPDFDIRLPEGHYPSDR